MPTFTNVKLAIKTENTKLKRKIAHLILETELPKLKQDFREINISLRSLLNVFSYIL